MYGAIYKRSRQGLVEPLDHCIGANSEVFAVGDLVCWASGYLEVVDHATSDRPIGICKKAATMTSSNQTVAKATVPYIPLTPDDEFEMDFDAVATHANVGQYFQLAGLATGTQQVSFASASDTVGQVMLVKLDPRGEGSTTRGLFRLVLTESAFEPET